MVSGLKIKTYHVHRDYQAIHDEWLDLCQSTNPSFFLCWEWVENWIKTLPVGIPVKFVTVTGRNLAKSAFFIGFPPSRLRDLFLKKAYLNTTGIKQFDKIYIEYNNLLTKGRGTIPLVRILEALPFKWDEFLLPALEADFINENRLHDITFPYKTTIQKQRSPYVDLENVRNKNLDYLSLLSGNTRSQIRRSYRAYQQENPLELSVASTLERAREIWDELISLHQESWKRRGKSGCFSNEYFTRFHKRLIDKYFDTGCIQLLKLQCGEKTLGCLYNFIHHHDVLFYQSGVAEGKRNKHKPGLMLHTEAIRYNAEKGYRKYDFLAGSLRYKNSLSTEYNELFWLKFQKKNIKTSSYNTIKKAYDSLKR